MRPVVFALLWLPLAAIAQTPPLADFSKARLAQKPLQMPAEARESAPPDEPPLALYKPAGPGPFPAVVLDPTCAGVQDQIGDWARVLLKAGYAVFVLDRFTQRNVRFGENCKPPPPINTSESTLDAYLVLEHLAAQPFIDRERVALVGFSWGAMVGLLAARKDIAEILPRKHRELRYRAIASLYPHCYLPSVRSAAGTVAVEWLGPETDRPLLVLMGEKDEETPPRFCLPRLEALKAKGAPVDWEVYPDTTHGWDIRRANGYAAPTFFGTTHTYLYNESSKRAAQERVLRFLAKEMPPR